jgi:anthranilate phosphoribosyltransferase
LDNAPIEALAVSDKEGSRNMVMAVLDNQPGPARDIVMLNAGAAIYVSGMAGDLWGGVAKAREMLAAGLAREKLEQLIKFTSAIKN